MYRVFTGVNIWDEWTIEEMFLFYFLLAVGKRQHRFQDMWTGPLLYLNRWSETSTLPCMPVGPKPWRVRNIAWSWCSAWSGSLFCCTKAQRHTFSRLREGFPRSMRLIDWKRRRRATYWVNLFLIENREHKCKWAGKRPLLLESQPGLMVCTQLRSHLWQRLERCSSFLRFFQD